MAIEKLIKVTYHDFKLNEIIDPEKFDQNNKDLVKKIDEIIDTINDGKVNKADDADKLGGQLPEYYAKVEDIPDISGKLDNSHNTDIAAHADIRQQINSLDADIGQQINSLDADIRQQINSLDADVVAHLNDYATYKDSTTLKVAKVEKELNDYKATMQQVNINQEPKQKATGYGIVSLPKNAANGQVSGVVRGETLTNLANNGDSYENWQVTYTVEIVNNIITIPYSSGDYQARLPVNLKPNTSYTIFYNIVDKVGDITLRIWDNLTGNYITNIPNALGQNRTLIKTQSTIMDNRLIFYAGGSTGDTISITDIMVFEGDYTDREIPCITGTKSTVGAIRARSVGKNILGGEKFAQSVIKAVSSSTSAYKTTVDNRNVLALVGVHAVFVKTVFDKFKENTQYTVQVYAKKTEELSGGIFMFWYTDGTYSNITPQSTSWEKIVVTSDAGKTIRALITSYANNSTNYYDIDTFQLEEGTTATEYEPYKESVAYITAKDESGNILELRSLPNGTKDEIRVSGGKAELVKRIGKTVLDGTLSYSSFNITSTVMYAQILGFLANYNSTYTLGYYGVNSDLGEFKVYLNIHKEDGTAQLIPHTNGGLYIVIPKDKISTPTLAGFKDYLNANPITLIYQLATPIEIPIQTSGSLVSYPSGTVYIEPFVADAGIYADNMEVLYSDLPIKVLEKLSKIDFTTGLETELNVSDAVIAEDKLSFTHPDLVAGDIVFFEYEYDVESTEGETEVEFYDSRYVIKDSVTDKFYKWHIAVANGVPLIELVEV